MSSIKFEGEIPGNKNKKDQPYSIDNPEDLTIEELMESIRRKIRRIQQSKQSGTRRT
ncbi:hypothetical protein SAMN05443144_101300 [Fodinibius roseus]|uniref:Uncharacterized protein n=1 Tax=Fodinibius roseus TaxID=1194090 RepID=A0A1M4TI12_9BACT|nr:hypothetical protein [Fodinibius roseus]SHE44142.1 hypothetical protein SAMN05443144_101300 [Fodinibius roseus]